MKENRELNIYVLSCVFITGYNICRKHREPLGHS